MSPTLWSDIPFKNRTALDDWGGVHLLQHRVYAETAAKAGKSYRVYPLGGAIGSPEWMRAHAQEHINAHLALGIAGPPNLTDYTLTDQEGWANFHFIHAQSTNVWRVAVGIA